MKKNPDQVISIVIDETLHGLRVDKALGMHLSVGSRSRAEALIESQKVFIDTKVAISSQKLKAGQILSFTIPEVESAEIIPLELKLDLIYEDEDLVVVNKPAGLVVHPAAGHQSDTLVNALVAQIENLSMGFGEKRPGIVHRLDRDTSGLLVVAKNDFSHEALALQFKQKTTHRIYQAVVQGQPQPRTGTIQSFLARHPKDRKRFASVTGADRKIIRDRNMRVANENFAPKWAVTHYKVLTTTQRAQGLSLVQLQLETGRTHQIRVHLSEMGWPILADPIYKPRKAGSADFSRLALHAGELGFTHPRSEKKMMFKVPWPVVERDLIQQIFGSSE